MAANPNEQDDGPDFSFLGDQSVPDSAPEPDFTDTPATDATDFSGFGDAANASDVPEDPHLDTAPAKPPAVVEAPDAKPLKSPKPPKTPTARRLKPRVAKPVAGPGSSGPSISDADAVTADPSREGVSSKTAADDEDDESVSATLSRADDRVSKKSFSIVAGYAAAITLLLLGLLFSGRISVTGRNILESLPDVQPLKSNEFRKVPEDAALPEGHTLMLGESRQFGDVVLTPFKVTREPIHYVNMMNGSPIEGMSSKPVLKLWFRMHNASKDVAFPPWDVALMSHRSEQKEEQVANSWLMVRTDAADAETQVLNFYHSPDNSFDLTDQHSRKLVEPGQDLTSYIVSSEEITNIPQDTIASYRWRIQIRKGVHVATGNGVTTLFDVNFSPNDIES